MKKNNFEYKLANGLVVALQNTPTQTVAARLRVNYGSSHERSGEEGMAHFLEHCLVTGGSRKYSPKQADKIRSLFGHYNAFTDIARTSFDGGVLAEDLESWLKYVSDHVFNPRFDDERINCERQIVLREIADEKSNSEYSAKVEYIKDFYRGHPKSIFVLGKEEVVSSASIDKIKEFHGRGYHPKNMDLMIAGGLPKNICEIIEKYFGIYRAGKNIRKNFPKLAPLQERIIRHIHSPERLNIENPEESSAKIYLRYSGPEISHVDSYAARAMGYIFGEGSNSRLFQNVRLKKGLAYQINSWYNGNCNVGEMGVVGKVPTKRINESIEAIFEEMEKLKTQKIEEENLNKVKKAVEYSIATNGETNSGHIHSMEMKLDYGITDENFTEGFREVTPEKVLEAANKYLPDKENGKYVLYILDPLKK